VEQALASLFVIIDPIGNILIFHLYSQRFGTRERLTAAGIAVAAAFVMLTAFSLGGQKALEFLGISEASFSVAAGLLLMPTAYRLVMEGEPMRSDAGRPWRPLDFALVPLATPLIAGPGALAATTRFAGSEGTAETLASVTIVLAITFVAFAAAGSVFSVLGESLLRLASRIVGIVLFAIAVDFVLDGLQIVFDVEVA
jgi:multiple antibiotic resistance protein